MMRNVSIFVLALVSLGVAQSSSPPPAATPTEVARLKAKAEEMKEYDRGKIYSEIAKELTEQANRQFTDGQPTEAQVTVQQVVEFAEKASAAAKLKNKKTKDTEITLRKTARRLEELPSFIFHSVRFSLSARQMMRL